MVSTTGLNFAPKEEVVEADPEIWFHDAAAEGRTEALGDAHGIALSISDRKRCGVLFGERHRLRRAELLSGPHDHLGASNFLAQFLYMRMTQQLLQQIRRRVTVGDADAGGKADGAVDGIE